MSVHTAARGACGSVFSVSVHLLGAGRAEGRREGSEKGRQNPVLDLENMLVGS